MSLAIVAAASTLCASARASIARHPQRVTALAAAMMLGAGGYATASRAPDVSDIPVRQVTETVETLPLQEQVELLDTHSLSLFRTESTRNTDNADTLLRRLGIDDPAANAFLRSEMAKWTKVVRDARIEAN